MLWGRLVRLLGGGLGWRGRFLFFLYLSSFFFLLVFLFSLSYGHVYEVTNLDGFVRSKKPPQDPGLLVRVLRVVGFFEDREDWADETVASPGETPQIGNLQMDRLGHQYARLGFDG